MTSSALRKCILLLSGVIASASVAKASTDYPPALWDEAYKNHWYKTGYGHKFAVLHDMEGYYLNTISYFNQSSTSASSHYVVNSKKDDASDRPAGEVTQMVLEAYYSWHARCWNQYSFGTEHEGFASNPAWFTYEMYNATGDLHRHLCDVWNIAKDRNHLVGHNEYQNAAWSAYASAAFGIDPTCAGTQTHTDPGQYWDWGFVMALVNNTPYNRAELISITAPANVSTGATFSATVKFRNVGNTTWTAADYAIGSQNPQDNTRWGMSRVAVSGTVAPGQTNTMTFTCTAPETPAIYPFEWKMVQGENWFGSTAAKTINVGNAQAVADIIVDNTNAVFTGTWSSGTSSTDKYATDYRYKGQGTGAAYATFRPNVQVAGNYNVYEWHPAGSNRTSAAPITINYDGGSSTVSVNQKVGGGLWTLLGSFSFAAGTNGTIQIKDNFPDAGVNVMADAIKMVYVP